MRTLLLTRAAELELEASALVVAGRRLAAHVRQRIAAELRSIAQEVR